MQIATPQPPLTSNTGAKPEKKRVFIVDDHPIFRQGLARLIDVELDLSVCGEAASAAHALEALRQTAADVVLVDISLPGADGVELVKHLIAEHPGLPILVVSVHDEQTYGLRSLRAGALGYLMKREGKELLWQALRAVLNGQVWVSPTLAGQLIYKVARGKENGRSPLDALTDRELEVLRLLGGGKSSSEIAAALHLSVKTVETHRLHVKQKLDLKTSTDLVRFAMDWMKQEE
jgi:DNA-binding NarL/FixJ family response regulator